MEMLINTGCARKPVSPGAHLEIHLLMPLFAWLFQGNGGPCPTTPCPHISFPHSSPWSCPASCTSWWAKATFPLFFKGSGPKLGKPRGRVKVTAWRKGTNFHNKQNRASTALAVWQMIPRVENCNNYRVSWGKLKGRDRPKGRQMGYSSPSVVM